MRKFFHLLLVLFTYPARAAEAVNVAKTREEFDRVIQDA